MRKRLIWMMAVSFVLIFLLPLVLLALGGGGAGMAVNVLCVLLVDPIVGIVMGALAGKDFRRLWWFPVFPAALTFASWMTLTVYLRDSLLYGGLVLAAGVAALLVTAGIFRLLQRERPSVN